MNLESAKPAVDQPVAKMDVRWVRKSDGVTLTLWLKRVSYSLSVQKRELSSHEWELSPEIQYIQIDTNIQNVAA